MGDTNELMSSLFAQVDKVNQGLEKQHVLPNFSGGYDLRERNGDVVASFQPGVGGSDGVILGDDGMALAHVREHAGGGSVFDFGMGHTVHTTDRVGGGETFHDSFEGVVGYTQPAFGGGMEFRSPTGEQLLQVQDSAIHGGLEVTSSSLHQFTGFEDYQFQSPLNSFDQATAVFDTADVGSSLEMGVEGFGLLDMLGDLF